MTDGAAPKPRVATRIAPASFFGTETQILFAAAADARFVTLEKNGTLLVWRAESGAPVEHGQIDVPVRSMVASGRFVALETERAILVLELGAIAAGPRTLSKAGRPMRFVSSSVVAVRGEGELLFQDVVGDAIADRCSLDGIDDGARLALSDDGRILVESTESRIRVRDLQGQRWLCEVDVPDRLPSNAFEWARKPLVAATGKRFAWASPYCIELRDADGRVLFRERERVSHCDALLLLDDGRVIVDHHPPGESSTTRVFAASGQLLAAHPWLAYRGNIEGVVAGDLLLHTAYAKLNLRRIGDGGLHAPADVDRHSSGILALAFAEDGSLVSAADRVCVWTPDGSLRLCFASSSDALDGSALSRDGAFAVTLSGGTLRCWDVSKGTVRGELVSDTLRGLRPVAVARAGRFAVLTGYAGIEAYLTLAFFDSGRIVVREPDDDDDFPESFAALASDDASLVAVSGDGAVRTFTLEAKVERMIGTWHRCALHFGADGARVLAGCGDFQVRVAPVQAGAPVEILRAPKPAAAGEEGAGIYAVAASDDGRVTAAGGSHGGVRVWCRGEAKAFLLRAAEAVTAVAVDSQGTRVAVGLWSGAIDVWDLRPPTPQRRKAAKRPSGSVRR